MRWESRSTPRPLGVKGGGSDGRPATARPTPPSVAAVRLLPRCCIACRAASSPDRA